MEYRFSKKKTVCPLQGYKLTENNICNRLFCLVWIRLFVVICLQVTVICFTHMIMTNHHAHKRWKRKCVTRSHSLSSTLIAFRKESISVVDIKIVFCVFRTKMLVQEHFNVTIRIFQVLGLATIPVGKKSANYKYFVNFIPVILSAAISSAIAIYLIIFPHFEPYSPIHTIINFASLIGFLLVVITANAQCYLYRTVYQNIFHRIGQIENRCRQKFLAKFPMKMALHYRLKVLLIFGLFFTSQGLVLVEVLHLSNGHGMLSSFLTSTLRSIFPIAILHVVLHSDMITMFIDEINIQIRCSTKCYNATSKIEFLKNVKLLHMDLWKLVGQLNIFFGWNLLVLIINSFIYITYQLYWIFLALELKWHTLGMVGKLNVRVVQICMVKMWG